MDERINDKGLRQVLKSTPDLPLPPNFTFQTMRKVEQECRLKARKHERRELYAAIIAACLLVCCGITALWLYAVDSLQTLPGTLAKMAKTQEPIPALYIWIPVILFFFLFLDQWLKSLYRKRHASTNRNYGM